MSKIQLSIIIPTYNRAHILEKIFINLKKNKKILT